MKKASTPIHPSKLSARAKRQLSRLDWKAQRIKARSAVQGVAKHKVGIAAFVAAAASAVAARKFLYRREAS